MNIPKSRFAGTFSSLSFSFRLAGFRCRLPVKRVEFFSLRGLALEICTALFVCLTEKYKFKHYTKSSQKETEKRL